MAEYIEREATKKEFNNHFGDVHDAVIANRLIDSIQAADVAPVRHGKWVFETVYHREVMKCSECNVSQTPTGVFTYCPNCGARMDLEVSNVKGKTVWYAPQGDSE